MLQTIGQNIRAAREAQGINQYELAALAGIHQPELSDYELGKVEPRLSGFLKVIDALGMNDKPISYWITPRPID